MCSHYVFTHALEPKKLLPSAPGLRQQPDQGAQAALVHVAELPLVRLRHWAVEPGQQFQPFARDPRGHEPSVVGVALPSDQPHLLEPVQKPGNVGDPGDEPVAYLVPAEPTLPRTTQDPERVVLRGRNAVAPQRLGHAVAEHCRRALNAEQGFLFQTAERPGLFDLVTEAAGHDQSVCVITLFCKRPGGRYRTAHWGTLG